MLVFIAQRQNYSVYLTYDDQHYHVNEFYTGLQRFYGQILDDDLHGNGRLKQLLSDPLLPLQEVQVDGLVTSVNTTYFQGMQQFLSKMSYFLNLSGDQWIAYFKNFDPKASLKGLSEIERNAWFILYNSNHGIRDYTAELVDLYLQDGTAEADSYQTTLIIILCICIGITIGSTLMLSPVASSVDNEELNVIYKWNEISDQVKLDVLGRIDSFLDWLTKVESDRSQIYVNGDIIQIQRNLDDSLNAGDLAEKSSCSERSYNTQAAQGSVTLKKSDKNIHFDKPVPKGITRNGISNISEEFLKHAAAYNKESSTDQNYDTYSHGISFFESMYDMSYMQPKELDTIQEQSTRRNFIERQFQGSQRQNNNDRELKNFQSMYGIESINPQSQLKHMEYNQFQHMNSHSHIMKESSEQEFKDSDKNHPKVFFGDGTLQGNPKDFTLNKIAQIDPKSSNKPLEKKGSKIKHLFNQTFNNQEANQEKRQPQNQKESFLDLSKVSEAFDKSYMTGADESFQHIIPTHSQINTQTMATQQPFNNLKTKTLPGGVLTTTQDQKEFQSRSFDQNFASQQSFLKERKFDDDFKEQFNLGATQNVPNSNSLMRKRKLRGILSKSRDMQSIQSESHISSYQGMAFQRTKHVQSQKSLTREKKQLFEKEAIQKIFRIIKLKRFILFAILTVATICFFIGQYLLTSQVIAQQSESFQYQYMFSQRLACLTTSLDLILEMYANNATQSLGYENKTLMDFMTQNCAQIEKQMMMYIRQPPDIISQMKNEFSSYNTNESCYVEFEDEFDIQNCLSKINGIMNSGLQIAINQIYYYCVNEVIFFESQPPKNRTNFFLRNRVYTSMTQYYMDMVFDVIIPMTYTLSETVDEAIDVHLDVILDKYYVLFGCFVAFLVITLSLILRVALQMLRTIVMRTRILIKIIPIEELKRIIERAKLVERNL